MITIQGFAKLCGCNTQTLRYYDRIGLLTPAKVDEWTGYRYYEEEQAMLFVKIKNLQQADFTIEEIKALLPGNDDLLMAAFERKIEEQQQKLERIREIQRSYLKETMDMQKLVSTIIVFVDEHLNNPVLWEEFGADMDRRTEITAKAHAILADMLAKNRETLETVTLTMDDQAVSGAENVIRAIQEAKRVLRPGGYLFSSFILMFGGVIYGLRELQETILWPKEQVLFDVAAKDESLAFEAFTYSWMTTVQDAEKLLAAVPGLRTETVFGQEGILAPYRNILSQSTAKVRAAWYDYALRFCEKREYLTHTEHLMIVSKKDS